MIDTTKLNKRIKEYEKYTKNYFIIDIDYNNTKQLIFTYAKLFILFFNNIQEYKEELKYNKKIRIYYSSSKTGFHIKVNKKVNLIENLYFRTLYYDDIQRVRLDLLRLNEYETLMYDIAFKYKKITNKKEQIKEYKLINPLELINMKKTTFYKLIEYIKINNYEKTKLLLNQFNITNKSNINDTELDLLIKLNKSMKEPFKNIKDLKIFYKKCKSIYKSQL